MSAAQSETNLTRKDFQTDQDVRWCPGCGDYSILAQVQKVMPELGIPRENIAFISGIGCSSRFPYYMNTYGFHTIHGRAPTIATGLKLARPELTVFVVTGDGDGLSIGGNHLLHAVRRNVDLKILLFNNRIYGLTKGQYSPTSEQGKRTKSTPYGSADRPYNPLALVLGAGATFVARTVDTEVKHLQYVLGRAAAHKGTAFVEIYQNCNVFNDEAFVHITGKQVKQDREIFLEHGKPLVFGQNRDKGISLGGDYLPRVVDVGEKEGQTPESQLVKHDEHRENEAYSAMLARLDYPEHPVPMGILRQVEHPPFEELVAQQKTRALQQRGTPGLDKLLSSGDTWRIT